MRAQISVEIVFAIAAIIVLFTIVLVFVNSKGHEIIDTSNLIDRKNECYKIANAINYLKINGPGTKAKLSSEFLITTVDDNVVIQEIKDITKFKNKIAVLASVQGTTTQSFYEKAIAKFNPDWYDNCYEAQKSTDRLKCDNAPLVGDADFRLINWNYTTLMQNISYYNTIYLEDAHTPTSILLNGKKFHDIQKEWVSNGGILILSEHYMCRPHQSEPGFICANPDTNSACPRADNYWYNLFGIDICELSEDPHWSTVFIEDSYFPRLSLNEEINFDEPDWIRDYTGNDDAKNMIIISRENTNGNQGQPDPSNNKITIAHWDYGNGHVFYLADFQTAAPLDYEDMLAELIQNAYFEFIAVEEETDVLCNSELHIDKDYRVTGNLELENVNNTVVIKNYA